MGLFNKEEKNRKEKKREEIPPRLPELPELPEFPGIEENLEEDIPQLPSFPNGSLGNKFSQDTIKEAVTGKKGVGDMEMDEFGGEYMPRMQKSPIKEREEYPQFQKQTPAREYPEFEKQTSVKETGPLFVRIDKFEEGSKILGEIRKKILDIERTFRDLKKIEEDEEKELKFWEEEVTKIKEKVEKIDNNIFSKLD
jgi:hypothetical protein